MQSKGKSVGIAAVFALLFLIMLPLRPVYDVSKGLTITATGERNPLAKSGEVWFSTPMMAAMRAAATRFDDGWEQRNDSLVSFRNQPAVIQSNVPIQDGDTLTFTMHEHSGIVEIGSGKFSQRYDLYSDTPSTLRVDLYRTLPQELNVRGTLLRGGLIAGAAFAFFLVATLFLARAGKSAPQVAPVEPGHREPLRLWLAVPSLVIYGVVLAAYWPGQMSADSVDQWWQIATGRYADAHPLMSTLLYRLAYLIYPAPQTAVIIQIVGFSAATWFFLREILAWGVPKYVVAISALLFPAFPGNFMLVSTLWKDIPFTIGLILLSTLAAREVRNKLTLDRGSVIAMCLAGILTFGVRHNGIIVVVLFFALLFLFAKGRERKIRVAAALISQIVVFFVLKTFLLSAMNASPVGPHYRSIFAMHILGAMESAGVPFDPADARVMESVLPEKEWKNAYDCQTVVPLFWNKHVSYRALGDNAGHLNMLMLKQIAQHPGVFLNHQLCVTGLMWRIGGLKNEFVALSPLGITDMDKGRSVGLAMDTQLPTVKKTLDGWHRHIFGISNIYTRPAAYLLAGVLAIVMIMVRSSPAAVLILAPSLFNCLSLAALMGSPDYRYLWPSVAMSLLAIVMAIGMAISGARMGGARQPQP